MIRTRVVTSLNKHGKTQPICLLCGERRGLCKTAALCRKCIRDGIAVTHTPFSRP